jgi:DNA gyrase subunit A
LPPRIDGLEGGGPPSLDIADELRDSYLTYAMSVIVSRALPDVRDGLKPSQRRILVAMNDLGLAPTASTTKCAGIIGETMKRYHPHGDQSIYPTLVRMAQEWNMRVPLIHPQGNFGSIAGLPPAAHRYTEARLTPAAAEMLADLDRDTVDFMDSYDGKHREPLVLPSRFPNLLVNGADGIAVGMATDIPTHNLAEVCTSLIRLIDDPEITLQGLMEQREEDGSGIQGPDFPTGGTIMGRQGILEGYATGRGKLTLRARADIDEEDNRIIIREVPYQQTRDRVTAGIAALVKDEKIKDIRDMRDVSAARRGEAAGRIPVRIEIELKRGANPEVVLNQLYQHSPIEKTVSIIMLALVDGRPRVLTLKQMLEEFLRHRKDVIRRRTEHLLREAKKRSHVIEGQLIAVSSLDEVIRLCREAESREAAKEGLQRMGVAAAVLRRALGEDHYAALVREIGEAPEYFMTEAQAEAVVRMQLGQLARLQRDEVMREYIGLRGSIREYEELLSSERNILDVIKKDLIELRDKYGEPRRTAITGEAAQLMDEDLIPEEDQVVTITNQGYIKRLPLTTYRTQHRGGRGVMSGTREDDFVQHFHVTSTHAYLLCFTNRGQLYWLRVFMIPEGGRTAVGRNIANVLNLKPEEKITGIVPVRHLDADRVTAEGLHLLMATRQGMVKKTPLAAYCRVREGGIIGIALDEGDTLIGVEMVKPGDEVVLSTRSGMSIRFGEEDARAMGRDTRGVKGIKLAEGDEVVGMVVADPEGFLLSVCANGYGKRTPFGPNTAAASGEEEADDATEAATDEGGSEGEAEGEEVSSSKSYRKQRRGGKGIRDIKTTERNGPVVGVVAVREGDDVMLITAAGMVNRTHVREVRVTGRNTQGVRLINLRDGDTVRSVARVAQESAEEQE